ncbi:MAG TPA: hypothetical protein EYG39_00105 [Rhodothermales bacterium]|nr:hypothetical protein [Rhodothermales bacterium]
MLVVYLDPYHLGDPLFATGLARDLDARRKAGGSGLALVMGGGEAAERAVEALGIEPEHADGRLVLPTREAAEAAERAAREAHRQLVSALNEEGVHAVRVTASDRGLVRPDGTPGKTAWLETLVAQGAVPVILSLVSDGDGTGQDVGAAVLSARLADAMGAHAVVALGTAPAEAGPASLEEAGRWVPSADALRRMASAGSPVVVARRSALRSAGEIAGARLVR